MENFKDECEDIAIIGMACRFPDAPNYGVFWENILAAKNSIREIPESRFPVLESYSTNYLDKNATISKWAGLLDDVHCFDAKFFGILPQQAKNMDPQGRLLLEEAWHCLEDASVLPKVLQEETTSVYVGFFSLDHFHYLASVKEIDMYGALGNYPCMLANRISYFFNLKGASISLDTACASSFAAIHQAKQALRNQECTYSLVGATNLISHPWHNITMSKCRVLSPEGQCKTFDASANGYVRGEGVGVLLLTTRENAEKKGHRIHALIKGSSLSHSGHTPAISTPSLEAQERVIQKALADSHMDPTDIDYLEAHGTGTALGDAIECRALSRVFQQNEKLLIGSIKANIGHLEAAAGMAGIIKSVLMLQQHKIPKHGFIDQHNPLLDLESGPLVIPVKVEAWVVNAKKRAIGISSMGFGGVNSHVILQENVQVPKMTSPGNQVKVPLVFSANSRASLEKYLVSWGAFLKNHPVNPERLEQYAFTLGVGRTSMPFRAAVFVDKRSLEKQPLFLPKKIDQQIPNRCNLLEINAQAPISREEENRFLSWLFSAEEQDQYKVRYARAVREDKSHEISIFLATCIYMKALIHGGIIPHRILGRGRWQTAALYISDSLSLCEAIDWFIANQEEEISYASPKYMVYKEYENNFFQREKRAWDSYVKELREGCVIDCALRDSLRKLLPHQFALRKFVLGLDAKLQKRGISFARIINSEQLPETIFDPLLTAECNLSMLLAFNHIHRKHQIPLLKTTQRESIQYIDSLVGDSVLTVDEALLLVREPERFHSLGGNPKYVASLPERIPLREHRYSNRFLYTPKQNESIKNKTIVGGVRESNWISMERKNLSMTEALLEKMVQLWLEGHPLSWDLVMPHFLPGGFPVNIPPYIFEKLPFWYELEEKKSNKTKLGDDNYEQQGRNSSICEKNTR